MVFPSIKYLSIQYIGYYDVDAWTGHWVNQFESTVDVWTGIVPTTCWSILIQVLSPDWWLILQHYLMITRKNTTTLPNITEDLIDLTITLNSVSYSIVKIKFQDNPPLPKNTTCTFPKSLSWVEDSRDKVNCLNVHM